MSAPEEAADRLIDELWDDVLRVHPVRGTYVGDPRHDHELPDPSDTGRAKAMAIFDDALAKIEAIDGRIDDPTRRITLEIAQAICRTELLLRRVRMDRWDVASHISGPAMVLGEIASVQAADTPEAIDRYEERLRAFPRFLRDWEDIGREGLAAGVVVPRAVVERTLTLLDHVTVADPADSPAMVPVRADDGAARDRIERAVTEAVTPAHARFRDFVQRDYLPVSPHIAGLSGVQGGDELYAAAIAASISLELDAETIHALGVERLASIEEERGHIVGALGFDDPASALAHLAADGRNTVAEGDLLGLVRDQVARSWEAAPAFFGRLPAENCQVRLVEEFRASGTPFAFYNGPTEDGSRPGTYYINPYELHERPKHRIAGVTFHEANPGHHFQVALEMQMPGLPPLRKFGADLAGLAFGEGWGLYAERLADEMGLYLDDWERLGMLENQAHRAARLIVDTGLHALGWDRERAIGVMIDAGLPPTDAAIEVDRYVAIPGQALCYMIGMIEIEHAREVAMARPGASLQTFHDEVLAQGQLPLPAFRSVFGVDRVP